MKKIKAASYFHARKLSNKQNLSRSEYDLSFYFLGEKHVVGKHSH